MPQQRYLPELELWANDVLVAVNSDGSAIGNYGVGVPVSHVGGSIYLDDLGIFSGGVVALVNPDGSPILSVLGGTFPPTLPIPQSGVTDLVADLGAKAPLASPTFTGAPQAPTPTAGDNDTSIATTAFVTGAVSTAVAASDSAQATALALKANLASPALTGTPTAPTPLAGDSDTSIATTAFVTGAIATAGSVADRDEMRDRTPGGSVMVYLLETGREGPFVWTAGDFSTYVAADPLEGMYVKATAVSASLGVWVRQSDRAGLSVGWFGAKADGVSDDQPAIQAALDLAAFYGGERVHLLRGTSLTLAPLIITGHAVSLVGHGGRDIGGGGSVIIGDHVAGPVLRIKSRHVSLRDFCVSAGNTRGVGGMITRTAPNRDDQNYGIWQESDDVVFNDTTGAGANDDLYAENVWVTNQPNSGWVIVGVTYGSVYMKCGARNNLGHGLFLDDGYYTARVNKMSVGVLTIEMFQSYSNAGHALAVTDPTAPIGPHAVRIIVRNFDCYNNGTDTAIMFDPQYDVWFFCDNSRFDDGAVYANTGQGCIIAGGRHLEFNNNRLLGVDTSRSAMKLKDLQGRETSGVYIHNPLLTVLSGVMTDLVDTSLATGRIHVIDTAIDGGYLGSAGDGAALEQKGPERIDRDNVTFEKMLRFAAAPTTLVPVAGVVPVPTSTYHLLDTEGGAATDDVTSIDPTGLPEGQLLILKIVNNSHVIVLKHGVSTLFNSGAVDITLNHQHDIAVYMKHQGHWDMITWASNS